GGAVDVGQLGELGRGVATEVAEKLAVLVQPPELADQLDRDDLAVGQRRLGAAAAEPGQGGGFQFVVHDAKYVEQELLRGHGGPPWDQRGGTVNYGGPPPFDLRPAASSDPAGKLAHRVGQGRQPLEIQYEQIKTIFQAAPCAAATPG